jgi:hypothetical protein
VQVEALSKYLRSLEDFKSSGGGGGGGGAVPGVPDLSDLLSDPRRPRALPNSCCNFPTIRMCPLLCLAYQNMLEGRSN